MAASAARSAGSAAPGKYAAATAPTAVATWPGSGAPNRCASTIAGTRRASRPTAIGVRHGTVGQRGPGAVAGRGPQRGRVQPVQLGHDQGPAPVVLGPVGEPGDRPAQPGHGPGRRTGLGRPDAEPLVGQDGVHVGGVADNPLGG